MSEDLDIHDRVNRLAAVQRLQHEYFQLKESESSSSKQARIGILGEMRSLILYRDENELDDYGKTRYESLKQFIVENQVNHKRK